MGFIFGIVFYLRLGVKGQSFVLLFIGMVLFAFAVLLAIRRAKNAEWWELKDEISNERSKMKAAEGLTKALDRGVDQTVRHVGRTYKQKIQGGLRQLGKYDADLKQASEQFKVFVAEFWRENCIIYREAYCEQRDAIDRPVEGAIWKQDPPAFFSI